VTVSSLLPGRLRGRGGADGGGGNAEPSRAPRAARPLAVTGTIAACAAAGAGLAVLTLLAALGWIAAPHASVGGGIPGVLRTAIQLWLVGHHVGFDLKGTGHVGLLPLGLLLLPGAALWRSGRWVVRTGRVARLRHVGYAALALALPYGVLAGALAVASRTSLSAPSAVQAAGAGFLLAFAAGGLGGARALAPWGKLIALLPDRPRCLIVGAVGTLGVLTVAGALLTGVSLLLHASEYRLASDELAPGPVGAALLLLAALAYLPNAVVWAMAYMIGPGFAIGTATVVSPTTFALGPLPLFPMLAALPGAPSGTHPAGPGPGALALLAVPYLAAAFGGLLTVRTAPSPTIEAAPLWGLASGVLSGCVTGVLAVLSGGPLGAGRLATVGPSGWQVALVGALQMGVASAIAAGFANWLLIRRRRAKAAALAAGATAFAPPEPVTWTIHEPTDPPTTASAPPTTASAPPTTASAPPTTEPPTTAPPTTAPPTTGPAPLGSGAVPPGTGRASLSGGASPGSAPAIPGSANRPEHATGPDTLPEFPAVPNPWACATLEGTPDPEASTEPGVPIDQDASAGSDGPPKADAEQPDSHGRLIYLSHWAANRNTTRPADPGPPKA
jgi:Family of unknown function (DUF6350)